MRDGYDTSPFNPVPAVVWLLVLPIAAMELVLSAGEGGLAGGAMGVGWRQDAFQRFALAPAMLRQMIDTGQWNPDFLMRFLTYGFVHLSPVQALFGGIFTLALGKFVAEVFRPWAVLAVFFGAQIVAGVVYSLVPYTQFALVGAYPAAYGLIGAFTFILSARLGAVNANRARAFGMIGFLIGIQLVFALIYGGTWDLAAKIVGFATGFVMSFVVAPGGPAYLLARMRQR